MNKKDYIEAIEEIKVPENLKREVLRNMNKKNNKLFLSLSLSAACVAAIVVGIMIPMQIKNKNNKISNPKETVIAQNLPNIENYKELYKTFRKIQKESNTGYMEKGFLSIDAAIQESATISSGSFTPDGVSGGKDSTSSSTNSTNKDYSKTNVQVDGVDEADIVKTDGNYIYYVTNNKIIIVNAQNKNAIGRINFSDDKNVNEIYIKNEKLVAICDDYDDDDDWEIFDYNKISYGNERVTIARVYDISNKRNVKLDREVKVDGYYLNSRMIDNNLYLITNKVMYSVCRNYDIDELKEDKLLPSYTDSVIGRAEKCVAYDNIYCIPGGESSSYLNMTSFDITKKETAKISSYIGAGENVYASENNLYVTQTKREYDMSVDFNGISIFELTTKIYRFKLDGSNVIYMCEGEVPGSVLNQFSMDEKDGFFRIATTNSISWKDEEDTNNLYVLDENLRIVGKVEGLAPGERIYSVRFMGKRAYMVTFVETDPLFVIDLSNPTDPKVLGELKIPGYSNYLHPYDDNHIIGIGEDTTTIDYGYGNVVKTTGMKMALFDVTDPTNPIEMYTTKIGDQGTYSEVLNNHKAFLFSKEKNLLAFPVSIRDDSIDYYQTIQGAIVYKLDLENGFKLKGLISHKGDNISDGRNYNYNYNTEVERIIYIGDELFTLSPAFIKVTDLKTMSELGNIELY